MAATATTPPHGGAFPWFIVEGVLLILFGVLAAALPAFAGLAAALVFGWMLLLSGILGFVALFAGRGRAHPAWSAVSALVAVLAGVLVLWAPVTGAVTLALFIAAYLIIDGIALIGLALDQRRRGARAWGWLVASGVIDFILAACIIVLGPLADAVLVGFIVAVDLIVAGLALVALGIALRRAAA